MPRDFSFSEQDKMDMEREAFRSLEREPALYRKQRALTGAGSARLLVQERLGVVQPEPSWRPGDRSEP